MWARGLKLAGTASRNRGPETSPAPAPAAPGGGNRRTPKKQRSRHNTNKTTHLRVPSGRQVPHVLQEEGAEDGVRLLRSPAPKIDPGGALVIHAEREQGFGGEEPGSSLVIRPWLAEPLSSHEGRARKGGGAGRHPGLFSQTRGALQRTQVAVERATPLETAWISFLLIQELFNVLELNAGKSGEGGVGAATEALTNPPQPKECGTAPGVEPRQRRGSSGFLLLGGTHSHEGRNRGGGRGPPRAAEGEPRGLLVL